MNFGSNSALDHAAERSEQERETKIAEASQALRGLGTIQYGDCGVDIGCERRLAMPSATRCIRCQTLHEKKAAR